MTQSRAATDPTTVHASIDVNAPNERAFEVFRDSRRGHIIDRGVDGSECPWATVLVYEPPNRFVFSWNISPYWQIETDTDKRSEVEVTFTVLDETRTA